MINWIDPKLEENKDAVGWDESFLSNDYKIVIIHPLEYLYYVDDKFNYDGARKNSLTWIRQHVIAGDKFVPLQMFPKHYNIFNVMRHHGRHRAFVANGFGEENMSVAVWSV